MKWKKKEIVTSLPNRQLRLIVNSPWSKKDSLQERKLRGSTHCTSIFNSAEYFLPATKFNPNPRHSTTENAEKWEKTKVLLTHTRAKEKERKKKSNRSGNIVPTTPIALARVEPVGWKRMWYRKRSLDVYSPPWFLCFKITVVKAVFSPSQPANYRSYRGELALLLLFHLRYAMHSRSVPYPPSPYNPPRSPSP
jgi:hypothetical protein